jgi:hypothetical protein
MERLVMMDLPLIDGIKASSGRRRLKSGDLVIFSIGENAVRGAVD